MEPKSMLDFTVGDWIYQYKISMPHLWKMFVQTPDFMGFIQCFVEYIEELLTRDDRTGLRKEAVQTLLDMVMHIDNPIEESAEGVLIEDNALKNLWEGLRGDSHTNTPDFYYEMYMLLTQLYGRTFADHKSEELYKLMQRWPAGTDQEIVEIRKENRRRIMSLLVDDITNERYGRNSRYSFAEGITTEDKLELVGKWWSDYCFHLAMAARTPARINRYLNNTLSAQTVSLLEDAASRKMPLFVTPYYLSLLNINGCGYDDNVLRSYIIYSKELVEAFGSIKAWEKEDSVEPGKPNAAGWLLPDNHSIHRRYPDVAILIPDTMGRACGGLCASCQRMYGFQKGNLNFNLEKLKPRSGWLDNLRRMLGYFETDSSLTDILITGGDALMSRNKTLRMLLNEVCEMAERKRKANLFLPDDQKCQEIHRVRLGTRLPVYLPCRIDDNLIEILTECRKTGIECGIRQFVIQTHFQTPLEVTPEAALAVRKLLAAGWLVTNQLVFNVAASRRGHTARLREVLNGIGVICYYTFTVKGFDENKSLFAPNCRSMQELHEEKILGRIPDSAQRELEEIVASPQELSDVLPEFMEAYNVPFISTDRNVMNLPGIGKSMTYRMIGVDRYGRRILSFTYDKSRAHSPVIKENPEVIILERKSVAGYLRQLRLMGENYSDYISLWKYRYGDTEPRSHLFEYPKPCERINEN